MALVLLRLSVGWHFYKAGTEKLQSGEFHAAPFIRSQAQGPFKRWFTRVLPNEDVLFDLLLVKDGEHDSTPPDIDHLDEKDQQAFQEIYATVYGGEDAGEKQEPEEKYTTKRTRAWWDSYLVDVSGYYHFGDMKLEGDLKERRKEITKERRDEFNQQRIALRKKLDDLREKFAEKEELSEAEQKQLDAAVAQYEEAYQNFKREEQRYKEEEQQILQVRFQPLLADDIVDQWQQRLGTFLVQNRLALDEYFNARERFRSYQEDPEHAEWRVVAGRQTQMARIQRELNETRAPLQAQLAAIWEGLEADLNGLAVSSQAFTETSRREPLEIPRPDLETKDLNRINKIVPWFDTIVGALLILGLFTRPAAFAGAAFLGSIFLMNPPWLSTSEVSYYQGVELFALLLLMFVGAGRYAGLDFFLRSLCSKCCRPCRRATESADVMEGQPVPSQPAGDPETSHESNT